LSSRTDRTLSARARSSLVALASAMAALFATAGIAAAEDVSTTPAPGAAPASTASGASGGGSPAGASSGSRSLKLKSEHASPDKAFYYGKRKAVYHYSIGGTRARNLKIQAVNRRNWRVVHTWLRRGVEPGSMHAIRWGGTGRHGRPAKAGNYMFRVRTRHGANANRRRTRGGDRSFALYPAKFPVRARHSYGDGYGAPRAGHVHQGQDILAPCGKRVVAARGGRIQYRAYQASGAGYYLVVDGKGTGHDYVYMHLRRHGRAKRGQHVRTGQRIGTVGETGDASGCHLHFEMWTKPGWYEGGRAMPSVTRHLRAWDRWS
jgi:murein DD-endopeptidase MepM/ murein hydrolase activator NlpD